MASLITTEAFDRDVQPRSAPYSEVCPWGVRGLASDSADVVTPEDQTAQVLENPRERTKGGGRVASQDEIPISARPSLTFLMAKAVLMVACMTVFRVHAKGYWRLRRRALHLDVLREYDARAPLARRVELDFSQAVDWISEGMAPLGEDCTAAGRKASN